MQTRRKMAAIIAVVSLVAMISGVSAMLNVSVTNIGQVVGQTKELTTTIGTSAQGTVQLFGTGTILPACATAAATSFADVATATLNWGTSLASNTDYEVFFCLGNIGTSAGVVHVSTTGQAAGETEVFEQAQGGVLSGLTYSPCDGASISGLGVISVRGHLHTPTAGLNGVISLTGKTTFTFS